jgi:DNA-binding CsgD family transcriptional regulator
MRLSNAKADPREVIVAPMAESGPWPHAPRAALAIIKTPRYVSPPESQELLERHGLTRAETVMAQRLCEGMTLQRAAVALGVRLSTARTHLKHIFEKTGTRRQAELVRSLLSQRAGADAAVGRARNEKPRRSGA